MKSGRKTNYIFTIAVILAVVGAVAIGASAFVDWNRYKPLIEAKAEEALGRKVTIEGEIGGMLFPIAKVTARNIKIANIEGGKAPYFAALEELEVHVSPLALLHGVIDIGYVGLKKPEIFLEKWNDEKNNWQIPAGGKKSSGGGEATASTGPALQLKELKISDGTLHYADYASGDKQTVEKIESKLNLDLAAHQFALDGKAMWQGQKVSLEADIKPGKGKDLNAAIKFDSALGGGEFTGTMGDPMGGEKLHAAGRIKARAALKPAIAVAGDLAYAEDRVVLQNAVVEAGDAKFTGDIAARLEGRTALDVKLNADTLDAGKLMQMVSEWQKSAGGADAAKKSATAKPASSLPFSFTGALGVKSLQWDKWNFQNLRLQAASIDGKNINLQRAALIAPGDANIEASGAYNVPAAAFDGKMQAQIGNVQQLAAAFGVENDWLKTQSPRLEFNSDVAYGAGKLALNNYRLSHGDTKADGSLSYMMGEAASLDLKTALRHPSLKRLSGQANLPADGKLALDADIATQLSGGAINYRTLQGKAKVLLNDVVYSGLDLKKISLRMKELNGLNDFVDLLNQAKQQGTTNFKSVSSDWTIVKGVANTQNLSIDSDVVKGKGSGTFDLGAMKMDLRNSISFVDHPNVPALGLRLSGDVKDPQKEFDTAALAGYFAQRAVNKAIEKNVDVDKLQQKIDKKLGEKGGAVLKKLLGQ